MVNLCLSLNQVSQFAVYGLLALSSSPCLSLLSPVSPVDCASRTPVSTAFIWRGFSAGRHRHKRPRSFPQPRCLGRCLPGSCNSFGLQFPLDSSSFWLVVSALGFQEHDLLIFLPMYGGSAYYLFLDCSTILWWASCSSITCVVNSHILNFFYLKYRWFLLFWDGWWKIFRWTMNFPYILHSAWLSDLILQVPNTYLLNNA